MNLKELLQNALFGMGGGAAKRATSAPMLDIQKMPMVQPRAMKKRIPMISVGDGAGMQPDQLSMQGGRSPQMQGYSNMRLAQMQPGASMNPGQHPMNQGYLQGGIPTNDGYINEDANGQDAFLRRYLQSNLRVY